MLPTIEYLHAPTIEDLLEATRALCPDFEIEETPREVYERLGDVVVGYSRSESCTYISRCNRVSYKGIDCGVMHEWIRFADIQNFLGDN